MILLMLTLSVFPYTTLFRSKNRMHINLGVTAFWKNNHYANYYLPYVQSFIPTDHRLDTELRWIPFFAFRVKDRKSTRLNSSHVAISYAVFCLIKKKT